MRGGHTEVGSQQLHLFSRLLLLLRAVVGRRWDGSPSLGNNWERARLLVTPQMLPLIEIVKAANLLPGDDPLHVRLFTGVGSNADGAALRVSAPADGSKWLVASLVGCARSPSVAR